MEPVSVFIFSRLLILCKIHLLPTSDVFAQARISQDTEHFLLNPFGMLYNEITASSLVKVNMQVREVIQLSIHVVVFNNNILVKVKL
jgi:ribulose-5-phosphate 4-epimerase/fuculose-1-phosphate aldolase